MELCEEEPTLSDHEEVMQKSLDHLSGMKLKDRLLYLAQSVKPLKVKSAFDEKFCKLEFHLVKGTQCEMTLNSILVLVEVASNRATPKSNKMHMGQAPNSDFEKVMQRYLETATE